MRGFMMVSIGRMVILGWISFISMMPPGSAALPVHGTPALLVDGTRSGLGFVEKPTRKRKGATMVPGSSIWVAWPAVAGIVVFWQVRRHAQWPQILGAVVLVTYAWWICSVAFFPLPIFASAADGRSAELIGRVWANLVPLREVAHALPLLGARQITREFGGNLLLFIPFTLFGPVLWPRFRTWRWPLAAGLGGSLAIELIQLLLSIVVGYPYRQADIDDVILNTVGAFAGYALFALGAETLRSGRVRLSRRTSADTGRESERPER